MGLCASQILWGRNFPFILGRVRFVLLLRGQGGVGYGSEDARETVYMVMYTTAIFLNSACLDQNLANLDRCRSTFAGQI